MKGRRRMAVVLLRTGLLVAVLLGWEGAYRAGAVDTFIFSAPSLIAGYLQTQLASGTLLRHLWVTVQEAAAGLALGFAAGTVLAWLTVRVPLLGEVIEPVLALLNAVPRIVLAPLFIMWLGIHQPSKIAVAFLLVFVIVFFTVSGALRDVPKVLIERVRVLGGGERALVREVYWPFVMTWVFSSLRVTVGFAFTGAIVGELVASSAGLGYLLNFALGSFNATAMMAVIFLILAIIMALFVVFERLEYYMTPWRRMG